MDAGIAAFHRGDYAEARRILAEYKNDPRGATFLALSTTGGGGCTEAEPDLKRQFTDHQTEPDLRRLAGLALAQCALARNAWDTAIPILAELRSAYPRDPDVLYESAKVYMRGWNDAVQRLFQDAPASYRLNQISAEIFEVQGRYGDAIAEYRKAVAKNPKAINLHYRLGRALLLEQHSPAALEEARAEFQSELALNQSDAAAEYQIAQILMAQQKSAEAVAHYENAARLDPKFPEALVALGRARLEAKQYTEAIQLLERAIEQRPALEAAHYTLMLAYRDAGRLDDARREKQTLDQLQRPPEGEFTEFLKKLGEKAPAQK